MNSPSSGPACMPTRTWAANRSGYFAQPGRPGRPSSPSLAGQGHLGPSRPRPTTDAALEYIAWFAQPREFRRAGGKWAAIRRSAPWSKIPVSPKASPTRRTFTRQHGDREGFWAEPAYASLLLAMQDRVHNYVRGRQRHRLRRRLDLLVPTGVEISRRRSCAEAPPRPAQASPPAPASRPWAGGHTPPPIPDSVAMTDAPPRPCPHRADARPRWPARWRRIVRTGAIAWIFVAPKRSSCCSRSKHLFPPAPSGTIPAQLHQLPGEAGPTAEVEFVGLQN